MGEHAEIDDGLGQWIAEQPLFFVGTAPLTGEGHINLSPRGLDTFRILGPREVTFLDLTGSGNETAAHLAENGRITVMFCSFSGKPRILRLYGRGRVILPGQARWGTLRAGFAPNLPGVRQIVHIEVKRVKTSCGFGVPLFDYRAQREELIRWAEKKGPDGVRRYRAEKNTVSLDGLPAPGQTDDG